MKMMEKEVEKERCHYRKTRVFASASQCLLRFGETETAAFSRDCPTMHNPASTFGDNLSQLR